MARKRKKTRRYTSRRRKKQTPFTPIVAGAVIVVGGAMLLVQVFGSGEDKTVGTEVVEDIGSDLATVAQLPSDEFFIPSEDQLTTTEFGLQYMDMVVGDGAEAQPGQNVSVHYTGWLTDGSKFDSSVDRGTPFNFLLGVGRVIQGWDQGVDGMRVGGKRVLVIPPELGYGDSGQGSIIPPGATLIFQVELLEIVEE